jgi:glutaryl-CoA dehydrogenase
MPTAAKSSACAGCRRWRAGETIGCFGLTEPHGGSDPANMKTNARKDGGDWILNGSKMWITNGNVADIAIVWAQTDEGIQGFVVEKGMAGFAAQEIKHKMSLRASVTSALYFDNVRVPEANRLPNVKGLKGPLGCLTQARYGITWGPIGAAIACLDEVLGLHEGANPVRSSGGGDPERADQDGRDGPPHYPGAAARRAAGSLKDAGKMQPRRCRWRSGTTAAWPSTSRANAATCLAARASPPSTRRSAMR